MTIQGIGGTGVTLTQPLLYSHYGEVQIYEGNTVDERAEVGLLTRNVLIQGDSASSAGGFGGHMMGMGGTLRVEGVELHFMGQKGKVARYPMHWHMMGAVDGQYFAGSSVWKSFNRCVTVHGTDNARVEGNVCYDHLGHGYFLEDGAETGNLIAGNLGLGTKTTADGEGVLPDRHPGRHVLDHQSGQHDSRQRGGGLPGLRLLVRAARLADRTLDRSARPAAHQSAAGVRRQRAPTRTAAAVSRWTTAPWPTATPRRPTTVRGPIRTTTRARSRPTSRISPPGSTRAAPCGCGAPT